LAALRVLLMVLPKFFSIQVGGLREEPIKENP
jgi:hypothetical protein